MNVRNNYAEQSPFEFRQFRGNLTYGRNLDIQREIRNMFMRTNICLFGDSQNVPRDVKVLFFNSYCICLYDAALWSTYNLGTISELAA